MRALIASVVLSVGCAANFPPGQHRLDVLAAQIDLAYDPPIGCYAHDSITLEAPSLPAASLQARRLAAQTTNNYVHLRFIGMMPYRQPLYMATFYFCPPGTI